MGGSQSREEETETEELRDYYGVRITHQLLDSLDGTRKVKEEVVQESEAPLPRLPSFNAPVPFMQQQRKPEPEPEPEEDPFAHLRTYLINSEKVGDLLLKVEAEEWSKVQQRAQELADAAYMAPNNPPPCQPEHNACLDCYQQNPTNALLCSDAVSAYSACTQESYQVVVQAAA